MSIGENVAVKVPGLHFRSTFLLYLFSLIFVTCSVINLLLFFYLAFPVTLSVFERPGHFYHLEFYAFDWDALLMAMIYAVPPAAIMWYVKGRRWVLYTLLAIVISTFLIWSGIWLTSMIGDPYTVWWG
jgi:hypothetical protein